MKFFILVKLLIFLDLLFIFVALLILNNIYFFNRLFKLIDFLLKKEFFFTEIIQFNILLVFILNKYILMLINNASYSALSFLSNNQVVLIDIV